MHHAFCAALVELYELAEQAGAAEFPAALLAQLQPWLGFDGAVLGLGAASTGHALHITEAHVQGREAGILGDYAALSADDPLTQRFLAGLAAPLSVDCRRLYPGLGREALDQFTRRHGLRQLMLFGDAPLAGGPPGRWLVLYRSEGRPFGRPEREQLQGAWPHVSRAIALQRRGRGAPARLLAGLSPREQEVAQRFAEGLSHKEIARRLGVSPHTVRSQLSQLYRKLDIHDKAALAQRLMGAA